jgi:hypothetical protein
MLAGHSVRGGHVFPHAESAVIELRLRALGRTRLPLRAGPGDFGHRPVHLQNARQPTNITGGYNRAMGVVEDVRKLLQDLVTPEMRALAVEVKAVKEDIGSLHAEINRRFDELRVEMNRRFDYIETSFRLDERVSLLEEERKERKKQHPQQ